METFHPNVDLLRDREAATSKPSQASVSSGAWTSSDRCALVAGATTLQERLDRLAAADAPRSAAPEQTAEHDIIARWRIMLDDTPDGARLARRLAWSGWRAQDLAQLAHFEAASKEKPPWLDRALHLSAAVAAAHAAGEPEDRGALPFAALTRPMADHGAAVLRERLGRIDGPLSPRLAPPAAQALGFWLWRLLTAIVEQALFKEFHETRPPIVRLLYEQGAAVETSERHADYDAFIARHGRDGLKSLFLRYPMMARLLATRVETWVEAAAEFVERLEADWTDLRALAGPDARGTGQLAALSCGLSDPHHGGRSVMISGFETGDRVVYKPRCLGLEEALRDIAAEISASAGVEIALPEVVARPTHGWMQFVRDDRAAAGKDAPAFWRNAGALQAFMTLLGGTDGHAENVLFSRRAPVLVDAETLFFPGHVLEDPPDTALRRAAADPATDAARRSSLLPHWSASGSEPRDISGFGAAFPDPLAPPATESRPAWIAVNSDAMRPSSWDRRRNPAAAPLEAAARPEIPNEIIDALAEGFAAVYRQAIKERTRLPDRLAGVAPLRTRFVHRPTRAYDLVTTELLKPHALASGVEFGLTLERLMRVATAEPTRPPGWALFEDAIAQMTALDVPYLFVEAGDVRIRSSRAPDRALATLWRSGLDASRDRLARLGGADLHMHLTYIRAAFEARRDSDDGTRRAAIAHAPPEMSASTSAPVDRQALLAQARRIGERLRARAVHDGVQAVWAAPRMTFESGRLEARWTPLGLFDGVCGPALFLAELDAALGAPAFEPVWRAALEPLRLFADGQELWNGDLSSLGLGAGPAGMLFVLARLRRLTDPRHHGWIDAASDRLIAAIDPDAAKHDRVLDCLGGSAGTIIGLLAHDAARGGEEGLARAAPFADRLLAAYAPIADADCPGGPGCLCGFSHGASGVAAALGRLWARTGARRHLDGVRRCLDFEDRGYDAETANWRDLRSARPSGMRAWCHGAPGVGLARIALLDAGLGDHDPRIARDLKRALDGFAQGFETTLDAPCCGLAGVCDLLIESERHGETAGGGRARAARLLAERVAQAESDGAWRLFVWSHGDAFDPGLFQGLSGIGMALLRAAAPERHRSFLLFDDRAPAARDLKFDADAPVRAGGADDDGSPGDPKGGGSTTDA